MLLVWQFLLLVIIQCMGTLQLFTLSPGDGHLDRSQITVNILVHVFGASGFGPWALESLQLRAREWQHPMSA